MKRSDRFRTLRGTISVPARPGGSPANSARRLLILDDGRINKGYRITSFRIFPSELTGGNDAFLFQAHLSMGVDITTALPAASDNREIGWAMAGWPQGAAYSEFHLLDPDHIIVRDLNLIFPEVYNTQPADLNYFITMEEYDITDQEAIISIIKEESQDVDN